MLIDTLNQISDTVFSKSNPVLSTGNDNVVLWKYVASVELCIILILIFMLLRKQKTKMNKELLNVKHTEINTDNLMSDIFESKKLYDLLIRRCHPDRFADEQTKEYMTLQSQRITENRSNYKKLLIIKEDVEEKFPEIFVNMS